MQVKLVQTCGACPEQYDGYINGARMAYLRLRHGFFRAEYMGVVVYHAYPKGDGAFSSVDERHYHLNKASEAILEAHHQANPQWEKAEDHYYMGEADLEATEDNPNAN